MKSLVRGNGKELAFLQGVLSSFFLSLLACTPSQDPVLKEEGTIVLELPGIQRKGAEGIHRIRRREGREFVRYYDPALERLRTVPLKEGKEPRADLPLDKVAEKVNLKYYPPSCCFLAPDSILLAILERKRLFLLDRKGNILEERRIERPDGKQHLFHASSGEAFQKGGDRCFIRSTLRISPFDSTRRAYYSRPPGLSLKWEKDSLELSLSGGWPEKYRERNYYDSYPHRRIIEGDGNPLALYSFKAKDSLYLFDGTECVRKVEAKSRYIDGFETFKTDSVGNIAYTKRFLSSAPHYGDVLWDPYRKLYYRQAFHPCSYKNPDGRTVKRPSDQPWSLLVLNENFEKRGEQRMDPDRYQPGPLLVSKRGLLVPRKGTSDSERMRFSVLKPREER